MYLARRETGEFVSLYPLHADADHHPMAWTFDPGYRPSYPDHVPERHICAPGVAATGATRTEAMLNLRTAEALNMAPGDSFQFAKAAQ